MSRPAHERAALRLLLLALLLSCTASTAVDDRVPPPTRARLELGEGAAAEPAAIAPAAPQVSFHDRLYTELADGDAGAAIALFANSGGVFAIADTRRRMRVISDPFDEIIIDYQAGILWLVRTWDRDYEQGLFMADLFAGELELRKVSKSISSWQLTNAAGETYPFEGRTYVTTLTRDSVTTTSTSHACGDECTLAPDIVDLLLWTVQRGYPVEPRPRLELLTGDRTRVVSTPQAHCDACGRVIELPGTKLQAISVESFGDLRHVSWNLYDPATGEFISAKSFARSRKPWNDDLITQLMICREHGAMVIEGDFRTAGGELIYDGEGGSGVCLHGGSSFAAPDLE